MNETDSINFLMQGLLKVNELQIYLNLFPTSEIDYTNNLIMFLITCYQLEPFNKIETIQNETTEIKKQYSKKWLKAFKNKFKQLIYE